MTTKKILFACAPFDGHFNPLLTLAVHLQATGHDVRWYTQEYYSSRLARLGIRHYPFIKAQQINPNSLENIYPERKQIKNKIKKINFDLINSFVQQGPLYYADLIDINREFEFDLLIADIGFMGVPYIKEGLRKPTLTIGVLPLSETSKDLAPTGLGITPSYGIVSQLKYKALRFITHELLFRPTNRATRMAFQAHGLKSTRFIFDEIIARSNLVLQIGSPGFEYKRSDLSENIRFIGALLSHSDDKRQLYALKVDAKRFNRVVLVTQGTVEKETSKLIRPTLEAFANTDTLVIATTGGRETKQLRQQYSQDNIIIEDFIPFADVLPSCDVYITNGGYGGAMLSIQNAVPMVAAGILEGKNEVCARIGYFKLGINLKTERPSSNQIRQAVENVTGDPIYKQNAIRLSKEMSQYEPTQLLDKYIANIFNEQNVINLQAPNCEDLQSGLESRHSVPMNNVVGASN